jgi:hypothetical protein
MAPVSTPLLGQLPFLQRFDFLHGQDLAADLSRRRPAGSTNRNIGLIERFASYPFDPANSSRANRSIGCLRRRQLDPGDDIVPGFEKTGAYRDLPLAADGRTPDMILSLTQYLNTLED